LPAAGRLVAIRWGRDVIDLLTDQCGAMGGAMGGMAGGVTVGIICALIMWPFLAETGQQDGC
jgi:predicted lipid-binding transport protein (Tim44 family)